MKHEWKKDEKSIYLPKDKPEVITIPRFRFYTLKGKGNPNDEFFSECIGVLYSLAYGIKMSPKQGKAPAGYIDYAVYPLEGVWDIDEEAKKNFSGTIDKNTLVFSLMIRQPNFVTDDFAYDTYVRVKKKKPNELLDRVEFAAIEEGKCLQIMHSGSYDSEPESFKKMQGFADAQKLKRTSHTHREIYLSDARRVAPEKLKTVLRFQVE
jgi:hypothetical protein